MTTETLDWSPHLTELRRRVFICVITLLFLFAVLLFFSKQLYSLLALPLLKILPKGQQLIAISITSPLFSPLKLSFIVACLLGVPLLLYQLWAFVVPGLYQHERRWIWPLLWSSVILFYLGIIFAYFIALPLALVFFTHSAPLGVAVAPDINHYLNFTLQLFLAFGITFEVPVLILLLLGAQVVTHKQLQAVRAYAIVGAFILAMLLGPPDVISQILLAIPLWLLYELGILLGRVLLMQKRK